MKRVVITGLGMVTSLGFGVKTCWPKMLDGNDGASPITLFDTTPYNIHIAHQVRGEEIENNNDRFYTLLYKTCEEAFVSSGLEPRFYEPTRSGIIIGTLGGGLTLYEKNLKKSQFDKTLAITEEVATCYPFQSLSARLAIHYQFAGPNLMSINACSAGNHALAQAYDLFQDDRVDVMMVGGAEILSITEFTHFHNLKTLAKERCAPFDKDRDGLMIGEGSGILIMEELTRAKARGAEIYCELVGYGMSCDAYHMTAPHPDGEGAIRVMKDNLDATRLSPCEIDYISAHGTGTPLNDKIETKAIKAVMGDRAYKIPTSSIKSMIGHTMGAASAIESVVCCLVIKDQVVPPTINYNTPDPECDLDYVPNQAREIKVKNVLNNAFAFGGNNVTVIFGKCE